MVTHPFNRSFAIAPPEVWGSWLVKLAQGHPSCNASASAARLGPQKSQLLVYGRIVPVQPNQ